MLRGKKKKQLPWMAITEVWMITSGLSAALLAAQWAVMNAGSVNGKGMGI